MVRLPLSLLAWGQPRFKEVFLDELRQFGPAVLPLQEGLAHSSYALDDDVRVSVLDRDESGTTLAVKIGIFYQGIVPGCSCADDPTPVEPQNEYCEAWVSIDLGTGEARIELTDS